MAEHLPSTHKALSSVLSPEQKQKKTKQLLWCEASPPQFHVGISMAIILCLSTILCQMWEEEITCLFSSQVFRLKGTVLEGIY